MGFIRKYPLFVTWLTLCALVFAGGLTLALMKRGSVAQKQRAVEAAEARFRSLASARPAPTAENLAVSAENLETLIESLKSSIADLSAEDRLSLSSDPIEVMPRIQRMIRDFRRQASVDYITIAEDEAFGFARYSQAIDPPARDAIRLLDKQRQILIYLVSRLFQSADPENPLILTAVQREWVESGEPPSGSRAGSDLFSMAPAVSAERPGAIETMAFRFQFTGYTEVLRRFLNRISAFDLPVVVRSVEVKPAEQSGAGGGSSGGGSRSNGSPGSAGDFPFDLFGDGASESPEGDADDATQPAPASKEPVIENNLSAFTVVVEYIDVVLDAEALLNPETEVGP
ncbi:MAG: hypothetical protein ACFE0O_09400 [Opitutales bacterium]